MYPSIKSNNKVFVIADKSRNIYKLENDEYSKLLKENVTKTYKKSNFNKVRNINNEAKQITRTLPIGNHTGNQTTYQYTYTKIRTIRLQFYENYQKLETILETLHTNST